MSRQSHAEKLVAVYDQMIDILVNAGQSEKGLRSHRTDEFLRLHEDAVFSAHAGGFTVPPDPGRARLTYHHSYVDGQSRAACRWYEDQLRALLAEAEAALGSQVDVPVPDGRKRRRKPRITVEQADAIMQEALQNTNADVAARICWTAEEWSQYVTCSPSTIVRTPTWKNCEQSRQSRKDKARRRGPRNK
jgi:hypothetical protein